MNISKAELVRIDVVLLTHSHSDHSKYIKDFLKMAIDCYMTQGTKDALGIDNHRIHIIKADVKFKIKDLTITPFKSFHDAKEPVNFLVSGENTNLVYITDTGKAPYKIDNLTHIMIEANYSKELLDKNYSKGLIVPMLYKRIKKTHLSIEQTEKFLKDNDLTHVKKIYLIHLSDNNSNATRFQERIQKLTGREVYIF